MLHFITAAIAPARIERFTTAHPYLLFTLLMVGTPVGIILAITLVAFAIMLPITFFMGWL